VCSWLNVTKYPTRTFVLKVLFWIWAGFDGDVCCNYRQFGSSNSAVIWTVREECRSALSDANMHCEAGNPQNSQWLRANVASYRPIWVVQCCTVLYSAVKCCTVLHSAAKCYTVLHSAVQCCTVLQSAVQCCKVLYSAAQCCKVLYSVAQCCKVLYSVAKCCTVLHSAATKFHTHTKQRAKLLFYISWSLSFWIATN
jgi:hypothetical protein